MRQIMRTPLVVLCAIPALVGAQRVEWPVYGGDAGASKYSTLAQIDRNNVAQLAVAWRWRTGEAPIRTSDSTVAARPGNSQATPLMIGDTLFFSTPYNRVVAMDATTGRAFWTYDPAAYKSGQPSNGTGFVHRGVDRDRFCDRISWLRDYHAMARIFGLACLSRHGNKFAVAGAG